MPRTNRVIIGEDYAIGREAITALFSSSENYEVVAQAEDGFGIIDGVAELSPDLVVMKLPLPSIGNLELLKRLKSDCPNTKVLVLTDEDTQELIFSTFPECVNGCLLKDASGNELVAAAKNIMAGKPYFSPRISEKIIQNYIERMHSDNSLDVNLTNREREILRLIAKGYKNKEIAAHCCISVKTVEKHRSNLMKKLDLHNSASLTAFAIQKGFITL